MQKPQNKMGLEITLYGVVLKTLSTCIYSSSLSRAMLIISLYDRFLLGRCVMGFASLDPGPFLREDIDLWMEIVHQLRSPASVERTGCGQGINVYIQGGRGGGEEGGRGLVGPAGPPGPPGPPGRVHFLIKVYQLRVHRPEGDRACNSVRT